MKYSIIGLLALNGVLAYPGVMQHLAQRNEPRAPASCKTNAACDAHMDVPDSKIGVTPGKTTPAQAVSRGRNHCGKLDPCTVFDLEEQYVSTTGQYAYQSPTADQIRGPCPGLNAAANHGYLPRSGVATLTQTVQGLGSLYGMSTDLAGILAAYAIAIDGDPLQGTWSIGGPQPALLGNILGKGQGISFAHNKYEGDTSIARCDAYVNGGDAHSLSTTRFAYAYASGMDDDDYDMDKFAQAFAKNTFRSEAQNSHYFAGALFSTTLVSPAAYNFVIAMMSNHTADQPGGYLNGDIFKTFFGVSGEYPNFTWLPGQERVPDNWYRRPSSEKYQAVTGVFGDLLTEFAAYPPSFRFGGNTNGPSTYVGIDIANFTNGDFDQDTLFQGNNLACFAYQTIQQTVPDFVTTSALASALKVLDPALNAAFGALDCPSVTKFNDNNLPPYPGRSYNPTGHATNC